MKSPITKLSLFAALLAVGTFGIFSGVAQAAGAAGLSMSPAGGSFAANSTVTVTISENSGADTVNVVEADLNYNSAQLQFVSASCNTGAFEIAASVNASGITCGTSTPKSGSQMVGTASFKVLTASTIAFASSSHIYRSTDNADIWNGATTGASYSIATPAPTPTPTPAPTGNTQSNNSSSTKQQTTAAGTAQNTGNTTPTSTTATTQPNTTTTGQVKGASVNKATTTSKKIAAKTTSNKAGLWVGLLAILAIPAYVLGRRYAAAREGNVAKATPAVAAASTVKTKKTTTKTPVKKTAVQKKKQQTKKSKN